MAEDPIDVEALLEPLEAGDGGVGEDLRSDYAPTSPYQRLRDARSTARAEERARDAEGDAETQPAEGWREVLQIGEEVIGRRSKDFEVAAWMVESLVRFHGLTGLAAGARVVGGLCDRFWDGGFPQPDEDGLEGRSSPIGGLAGAGADGTIMQPLRRLPMFRRADGSDLALYQYDQAEEVDGLASEERREARYAAGVPRLSAIEAEARLARPHLTGTWKAAGVALEAWREMETKLRERFGSDAPSTRNVTNILERMITVTAKLGGAQVAEGAQAADGGGDMPVAAAAAGGFAGGVSVSAPGQIHSREDALQALDKVAEYFRKSEPHSPLAYTLEEAVRRGRMTLPELLAEVLPDQEQRNQMLMRLGIRPDDGNSSY
jgi:type VI secretion system protein ImpA